MAAMADLEAELREVTRMVTEEACENGHDPHRIWAWDKEGIGLHTACRKCGLSLNAKHDGLNVYVTGPNMAECTGRTI